MRLDCDHIGPTTTLPAAVVGAGDGGTTLGVFFMGNLQACVRPEKQSVEARENESNVNQENKERCLKKSCSRACLALIRFFGSISRHLVTKSKKTLQKYCKKKCMK
jgi:hypothetical protein